ncbi:EAL domain-containing response regulator [Cupriavidus numazuensis]|uniref:EAL domain-containing protein n=1 Tax=Cupriavidus numazuensis TaxID=221992 RepID=A0ABN7Q4M8_9BURK|nr:EAL domain-containing response regulator [Cupriavidus numazuensis]CAG2156843.1 hypothetical protein LMG26411_05386 [Cupriavidus numazuensis]
MTINVLVIDSRACQRAHTQAALNQAGDMYCEAAEDVDDALKHLEAGSWDVVVCALPACEHGNTNLIDAIIGCGERPDLVLTTHGDPILLTNTMRLAQAHGIRVRGYAVDPISPNVLLGLVISQGTSAPCSQARAPSPRIPAEEVAAALARGEIQVRFLPQSACRAHDQEIIAAEARLSWHHPLHGWLDMRDLVRLVTGTEHACVLFHHSLRRIGEAMVLWRQYDFHPAVSCIVPLCLLNRSDSPEGLETALNRYGLHARDITFELDLPDLDPNGLQALAARLLLLRQQGVEFSIRNYGATGTTLANLIDLPVSEIKLASDLINGIGFDPLVQRVVSGIVALAKALDMRVVATSVQRRSDVEMLATLGCDFAEGPVVGGPCAPDALARLNQDRTRQDAAASGSLHPHSISQGRRSP